ncbi:hypothetical protein [Fretibacter rubidus]|uniref:hypothetical protein n=1 Tax=Fretibacter rubidus TaxID=570162 RepID=UPI00352BBE7E
MLKKIYSILFVFGASAIKANAQTQPLATGTSFEPPIARLVIGLLLCVFLAYAIAHVLRNIKKNGRSAPNFSAILFGRGSERKNTVAILETHRLNATSDISLVAYDDTEYLILVGHEKAQILAEKERPISSNSCFENAMKGEKNKAGEIE